MSYSSDDQSDKECPLCMEPLEIDDVNFYPCKCEYQICRFCWHRLRTDENGLCPACRQPYPEDPVNFKPLSTADLQKIKSEKKMKQQAERLRVSESRKHLASYRVLQKNLVYVVGLSPRVADPETLKRPEYFGKFGKICKVVVGTAPSGGQQAPSHTAYVTYSKVDEALKAIQGVQNALLDGRVVKASLGTTKYCSCFLRSQQCFKPECMYLHDIADSDISFTKEDMHAGRHAEYERKLIDSVLKSVKQTKVDNGKDEKEEMQSVKESICSQSVSPRSNSKRKEENNKKRKTKASCVPRRDPSPPLDLDPPVPLSESPPDDWQSRVDDIEDEPPGVVPSSPRQESPPQWQRLLGLAPKCASPPPGFGGFCSDDDLGFDPFSESSRELAQLVEEEKRMSRPVMSDLAPPLSESTMPPSLSGRIPVHEPPMMESIFSSHPPRPSHHSLLNSRVSHRSPFELFPSYDSSVFNPLPPGLVQPPPGLPLPSRPPQPPPAQNVLEWQEGLRALLPNVNIRFTSSMGEAPSDSRRNSGYDYHHMMPTDYAPFPR